MFWKIVKTDLQTTLHKYHVMKYMLKTCWALFKRAFVHDFSKYSKYEAPYFAQAKELKQLVYGSPEYIKMINETLHVALEHHYKNNAHHPEHYPNGFQQMELLDVIELLCDWKAASLRNKNGNIADSIEYNMERFHYDSDMMNKMATFYKEIGVKVRPLKDLTQDSKTNQV